MPASATMSRKYFLFDIRCKKLFTLFFKHRTIPNQLIVIHFHPKASNTNLNHNLKPVNLGEDHMLINNRSS